MQAISASAGRALFGASAPAADAPSPSLPANLPVLGEPALVGVDPATGLDHHGGIVITGALPWRDYAATLVVAKEAADKMAVGYSHWPLVVITVRKRKNGQPVGLSTDLGVPDLTALPDWPKLLATLRGEFRHNNSQRTERECQRLLVANKWQSTPAKRPDDDTPLAIRPPRPFFGMNVRVLNMDAGSISYSYIGGLQRGDVIIGLDGVFITRGVSQITALMHSVNAPCEHTFIVRRKGARRDPALEEAQLSSLRRMETDPLPTVEQGGATAHVAPPPPDDSGVTGVVKGLLRAVYIL